MRIRLEQKWIDLLLKWPESGMGYQRVDVRLADGHELENVVVYNAEDIELPDRLPTPTIVGLRLHKS